MRPLIPDGRAATIRDQGGHYLLAVKGNQPILYAAVRAVFEGACAAEFAGVANALRSPGAWRPNDRLLRGSRI